MKNVNWRAIPPILLLGAVIVWLIVWTSARASNPLLPWIVLALPMLLVGFGLMALAAWLRRRKSRRTWDLMLKEDPDANHFIAFVYPPVKIQLESLGWRLHGPAYLSIPAVGISMSSTGISFWEAGTVAPTLTLTAPDVVSAAVGRVSDGHRSHPSIELKLNTKGRSSRLQLNLRDVHHRNLLSAEMNDAVGRAPVLSGPHPPQTLAN
jgi:hypothetical protein